MDVTDVGPFTRVKCPGCDQEVRVKTELGAYRLVRRHAIGGMSVLFVAQDETLGREVVVKVLSEQYSDDARRGEQFEREAEMTAAVSHPNVVRVFTVGRAFGRFYIAMEFVEGGSLEDRMEARGALPESEVIPMALQVVEGLRAAHGVGLVHRDIKPGNILFTDQGVAKIVDFGLSLLTVGGSVKAEEIWATPYYVPPEALENEEEDFRSDIYALGATLYHALAGRPPVRTKEMSTAALREEKRMVPSLRTVAPWLKDETIRVVEKAMALRRENRFSSYEEFRSAFEEARSAVLRKGEESPAQGEARERRRQRNVTHRKAWLGAGATALLVGACVVSFLLAKARRQRGEDASDSGGGGISGLVMDAPVLDPVAAAEIDAAYGRARRALREDDFVVAEEGFMAVWQHLQVPSQTGSWAGFESVLAAYLDGRAGDARDHLQALEEFIGARKEGGTALGRELRGAIELMGGLEFVPEERVPLVLEDPFRASVLFGIGLKTWEQGRLERAAIMFRRFRTAGPWPEAEWMGTYQDMAGRYVRDFERLQLAEYAVEGKSAEELEAARLGLEELYGTLQTHGRARFNVKVWQADLVRAIHRLRAAAGSDSR